MVKRFIVGSTLPEKPSLADRTVRTQCALDPDTAAVVKKVVEPCHARSLLKLLPVTAATGAATTVREQLMSINYDPDPTTSRIRFEYTTAPDDSMSSDQTVVSAWSSSPLGNPAAGDGYLYDHPGASDRDIPTSKPRSISRRATLAAALLCAVGVGAGLGIAILDYTGSAPSRPAVVVPATRPHPAAPPTLAVPSDPPPVASPNALPPAVSAPGSVTSPADSGPAPAEPAPANTPAPADSAPVNAPAPPADPGPPPPNAGSSPADLPAPPMSPPMPPVIINIPPLPQPLPPPQQPKCKLVPQPPKCSINIVTGKKNCEPPPPPKPVCF
jgi:hypothetical protein